VAYERVNPTYLNQTLKRTQMGLNMKLCSSKDSRNRTKQQTRKTRLYNNTTYIKIMILIKLISCDREKLQMKKN